MTATPVNSVEAGSRESWVPMIAIALGQAIMSFNVASLPVALGGMVESFGVAPTVVATGIVAYSMIVAGFVMLGAKLVQRFGALRVFRLAVILFGVSQVFMTFSPAATIEPGNIVGVWMGDERPLLGVLMRDDKGWLRLDRANPNFPPVRMKEREAERVVRAVEHRRRL